MIVPGTPTVPLIQSQPLLVLPQPFTPCTQMLYPDPFGEPTVTFTDVAGVAYGLALLPLNVLPAGASHI